jgi:hypothetical protein
MTGALGAVAAPWPAGCCAAWFDVVNVSKRAVTAQGVDERSVMMASLGQGG